MRDIEVVRPWGTFTFMDDPAFQDPKFEWEIFDLAMRNIGPEDTVFDIGAHQGIYTTFFATRAREVYAFEPHPDNYQYLLRNVKGFNNVRSLNMAAGDTNGKMPLYSWDTSKTSGTTGMHSFDSPKVSPEEVQSMREKINFLMVDCITIDRFVRENDIGVDLMKIDVEMWELHVINGARHTIESQNPKMIIEIHGNRGDTPMMEIAGYFNKIGMPYKLVTGSIPTLNHRGWFMAVNFP